MILRSSRLVRTKLNPPRSNRFTLPRQRLINRLRQAEEYRITILQAGTGYGKSTVLSLLSITDINAIWYHLSEEDSDPYTFVSHLLVGLEGALGRFSPALPAQIEEWEQSRSNLTGATIVDILVNETAEKIKEPLFLVIDDAHMLNLSQETCRLFNRFLNHAPSQFHTICATRYPIDLPDIVMWRLYHELLEIKQHELAFTIDEIETLFQDHYNFKLSATQASMLNKRIEGWPIALPLIWQNLQRMSGPLNGYSNGVTPRPEENQLLETLTNLSISSGDLFRYLTGEVLSNQPEQIQTFLRETAVLRELSPQFCDALRDATDSADIIAQLQSNGLFVVSIDTGKTRYHHLFRDVLLNLISTDEAIGLHQTAGTLYENEGNLEEAIFHYLTAALYVDAVRLIAQIGRQLVNEGRLQTLSGWINQIPPSWHSTFPHLLVLLGHIERLHSRFDDALHYYQQAEHHYRTRHPADRSGLRYALCSQARIFLDTVNPTKADTLLVEALEMVDSTIVEEGEEDVQQQLFHLMAENRLNLGDFKEADKYQRLAVAQAVSPQQQLVNEDVEIRIRLLLRTGRLHDASNLVKRQLLQERERPILKPRAHRETLLIESLLNIFMGDQAGGIAAAQEGIKRGEQLNSNYITGVGYGRLGMAHLLSKNVEGYKEGAANLQKTIDLSERLMVPRLRLIAYWGLCQAEGFRGDLTKALQIAQEAAVLARQTGDRWIDAAINLQLGASYALAQEFDEGIAWLNQAYSTFINCGDRFGETLAHLWRSMIWFQSGDEPRFKAEFTICLRLIQANAYQFLFTERTYYGPPDPKMMIPMLINMRHQDGAEDQESAHIALRMLEELNLSQIESHPGYQLVIHTLGPFRVSRGSEGIGTGDWKRQKARQLFQLLITYKGALLEREQIVELLWPELDADGGQRDFKIAYTTLCKVLEPNRGRKTPSAYVLRDGTRYGLWLDADLWIDSLRFEQAYETGDRLHIADPTLAIPHYKKAVALYLGGYLQEYPYEEWADEERNRLKMSYLRVATRLGELLLQAEAWTDVIRLGEKVLQQDNCQENTYLQMMKAYQALGQRPEAIRLYQQCADNLQNELAVKPGAAIMQLYASLNGNSA